MNTKEILKEKFSSDYKKYYKVQLFDKLGFKRKVCHCGTGFWTLDDQRTTCPNPPCQRYEFIGNTPIRKIGYIESWKKIKKFFVKNGHKPVDSYPVVCRWFPGLYFTVASIVAFQRMYNGKTVFELPANPLIIPQSCMRFNDIQNVGVTGRHMTNFVMVGQHSLYDGKNGYWKDRCIELDYKLLTDVFKISPEEITFLEDVWVGPNAFGYSLEYYVRGLELGNAVFTEFLGTPDNYQQMDYKVVDMGAGLERFAWLSQGTPTCYDAVFGSVIEKLKKGIDYDKDIFLRYSKSASDIDADKMSNYKAVKETVARELKIDVDEMIKQIEQLEAIYAIADHSKSLLYAVSDGAIPSNVGGGYNLRVILRRALGFIEKFGFDIDLAKVCRMHAMHLKNFSPRLKENLGELDEILKAEESRFRTTKERGSRIVESMTQKRIVFDKKRFVELYESHGIMPEMIIDVARKNGIEIDVPGDFYHELSEKHMKEETHSEPTPDVQPTKALWHECMTTDARVLKIIDNKIVVLDQTCFYPQSGGQDFDQGWLNNSFVYKVEKVGNIVYHYVENSNFNENDTVHCRIDIDRRKQLTKHHSAIHIINGAARKVLGNHVWQAGSSKSVKRAHIDITHFKQITDEEIETIETMANKTVKKGLKITKKVIPRQEAEKKYGMRIYQGGAVPEKELRIIEIDGFDAEACSGTHCNNTKETGNIIITSSERIQDGAVRINIVSGEAATDYIESRRQIFEQVENILSAEGVATISATKQLFEKWKKLRKRVEKKTDTSAKKMADILEKRFVKNVLIDKIEGDMKTLQSVSKMISSDNRILLLFGISDKIYVFGSAGKNTNINIGELVRSTCQELGGKGGGLKDLGQGIGYNKEKLDEIIKDTWRKMMYGEGKE
ncbi:MAG: alanine--tRNA ligase [Candidatus Aenigmatarchaeota archaeon]